MSFIVKYTTDSLGFVPRLWQIWKDEKRGTLRCIRADRQTRRNDAERRDAGKPKRKYDAKKRAPKLKRGEEGA